MTDENYINIAIDISRHSRFPYGAIVILNGEIIGRSGDDTLKLKDTRCIIAEVSTVSWDKVWKYKKLLI